MNLYRNAIAKALREELGSVKLASLTVGAVQKALTNLAAQRSTRTVQIAHNVLVRAIRHAERDDLVGRNVAALVKPPKGQLERAAVEVADAGAGGVLDGGGSGDAGSVAVSRTVVGDINLLTGIARCLRDEEANAGRESAAEESAEPGL